MAKVDYLPKGYQNVIPYLVCEDVRGLMKFLQEVFSAKVEGQPMEEPGSDRIKHAEVVIGNSHVMMGGATKEHPPIPMSLYVYVEDADEVYKRAIKAGASSIMEPVDMFYGDRHGGVKDKWGNQWWMATHIEDLSWEELKVRSEKYHAASAAK